MIKDYMRALVVTVCAVTLPVGVAVLGVRAADASEHGSVAVDVRHMPSSDCWWEVGLRDDDGRPGGSKSDRAELMCP